MAYTTINKSTDHFNTKLYTGNASTQAITGVGFQPDWLWIKNRVTTNAHNIFDAVRGTSKKLDSAESTAQNSSATNLTSFDSDGFTLASNAGTNGSGNNIASWNWKAGGGQGSSNTDGSINTTYTSANTTAGFSISTYTGTGSNATFGHGLGAAPEMVIVKCLNDAQNWFIYHQGIGATKVIYLDLNNAQQTLSQGWNNTAPTSSVVSIGTEAGVNQNGNLYVAYCFKEKTGYSKFGSYTGNGSNDGTFIFCGFKPAFIITKNTSDTYHWNTNDAARDPINVASKRLYPSSGNEEVTSSNYYLDFLSNGFKIRTSHASINNSGHTFAYLAFGQSLVGSNDIPCTAR